MVDDDPQVHRATRMVLSDFVYKGGTLDLIEAGSAKEASVIIRQNMDIAVILLDVVMETDEAGFDFIDYVRNGLNNRIVQIVLKTGQPGRFPEREVVSSFDINNFFTKTELTAEKMHTVVFSALRGYELTSRLKRLNKQLRKELEIKRIAQERLRRSEEEVKKLNQLHENIINSTDIWLHAKDINGNIIVWNKAAESISGYSRNEILLGRDIWNRIIPAEKERKKLEYEESLIISSLNEPVEFETPIRAKSGKDKVLSWHLRPLKNTDNSIVGISYLGVDITDKKVMEKKFFHSQKMEAIGRLAGGVAHDFNNTLTVIRGYCELLLLKAKGNDNLCKNVVQIDKAAEKAERLTRQLLSFSRHQLVKTELFDLNELVVHMESLLSRLVSENIIIHTHLDTDELYIKNNRGKVEQALMNLVVNSVDAMPCGGDITISTYSKIIKNKEHCVLSVRDTGVGIPKRNQSKVFDPFYTTKSKEKGTGLGLSTVYGVVKQCGGSVAIRSAENKGTEISLFFPAMGDLALSRDCKNLRKEQEHKFPKVLIAEESKDILEALAGMFENEGYDTVCFNLEDEAYDFGQYKDIDVLVTDFIMPFINGPELYEKLSELNPGLKVVYTSGYSEKSIPKKSDIHIFLEKPFTSPALFSAVNELLSQKITT